MSRPTKEELNELAGFQNAIPIVPNLVTDVYKNRRGRWNMVRIWSKNDLGVCLKEDLFVTTALMKPIEDFNSVRFDSIDTQEFDVLCQTLNKTTQKSDCQDGDKYCEVAGLTLEDLPLDNADSFTNKSDISKRLKDKSFADLL